MSRYGSGTYGTGLYGSTLTPTATEQDVWPARVLVSVTGLNLGEVVSIYRSVSGQRTVVRGADGITMTDTSLVRVDAELPFGVPVTYVVVVDDDYEYTVGPTTYTLVGGKVAITDAVNGNSSEVTIPAWPTKRRDRVSATYVVGGRNVVVSGTLAPSESEIEAFTETDTARENLADTIANATSGVVLVRQSGAYSDVDGYYAITSASTNRYSQDGTDERRLWTLQAVEVESWASLLEARGFTYADVADAYLGLTYANLASDYATYLAVAQGDFS